MCTIEIFAGKILDKSFRINQTVLNALDVHKCNSNLISSRKNSPNTLGTANNLSSLILGNEKADILAKRSTGQQFQV